MTATRGPSTDSQAPALRRTLTTWGAISLSIAAMGASLAVNINPQGAGATVGRAVPLTFILATLGLALAASRSAPPRGTIPICCSAVPAEGPAMPVMATASVARQ